MNKFSQEGKVLEYSNAGSAIVSGQVIPLASVGVVVAMGAIAASTGKGSVLVEGVVELAKETSMAFAFGDPLYWDTAEARLTKTSTGNTICGFASEAAGSSATVGKVKLVPMADSGNFVQAANVAALAGTLTGTVDGTLADVAAIAISTSGGNTYSDTAVNTAVNTAITSINLQLKELQTTLNAEIAALKTAGLQASS